MTLPARTISTLDLDATIGPQLHRILRQRIIHNDLYPGMRISETEIAREYSVSRQPVREAFVKLAEEGLVKVRPQRGTFVREIEVSAVLDAQFVREAIESEIAKLLASQRSDALVEELRRQVLEQRQLAADDNGRFFELDERFHKTLAEAAGKAHAWGVIEGVKSQMDRVRLLSLSQFRIKAPIDQHEEIVEAIAAKDVSAAEAAVREHLGKILEDLSTIAETWPNFFRARDLNLDSRQQ